MRKMKGISSEKEYIEICKCRERREVKGWTSSSKQQEPTSEPTNTKEEICLEYTKRKVKRAAIE